MTATDNVADANLIKQYLEAEFENCRLALVV